MSEKYPEPTKKEELKARAYKVEPSVANKASNNCKELYNDTLSNVIRQFVTKIANKDFK